MVFAQSAFYDSTSTASCSGSPIMLTSTGTGCTSGLCQKYNNGDTYSFMKSSCETTPLNVFNSSRDYVVKYNYITSDTCNESPITVHAVAADDKCHPDSDKRTFFKTNCNGNNPIWTTCTDRNCNVNCTTIQQSDKFCNLIGAGASNKIECLRASVTSTTVKSSTKTPTSTNEITGDLTFQSSSKRSCKVSGLVVCMMFILLV